MRHFKREEFACRCGCGYAVMDCELIEVLEDVREHFNSQVHINSGCRCSKHNKEVGGKPNSKHKLGIAADITLAVPPNEVFKYLNEKYPNKYGIGNYKTFTHIDVRRKRARW